jgi:predicted kinase
MQDLPPRRRTLLVIFGGLPGTGKSTLAQRLAALTGAVYLRIDTIEQAIRDASAAVQDLGELGYRVAYGLARDNLRAGLPVVADSVNPLHSTRDSWRAVGEETDAELVEVELICSDLTEHRRRIETRVAEVAGLRLPTWAEVRKRPYDAWNRDRIVLDTAGRQVEQVLARLIERLPRGPRQATD